MMNILTEMPMGIVILFVSMVASATFTMGYRLGKTKEVVG